MSAAAVKARLAEVLRRVEAGERVVVERRGRPVAVLVPYSDAVAEPPHWSEELVGVAADVDDMDEILTRIVADRRADRGRPFDLDR